MTGVSIYRGVCRRCERDIEHHHPKTDSEFGESNRVRVRCAECGATNAVEKEVA